MTLNENMRPVFFSWELLYYMMKSVKKAKENGYFLVDELHAKSSQKTTQIAHIFTLLDKNACSHATINHVCSDLILSTKAQKNGKERNKIVWMSSCFSKWKTDQMQNKKLAIKCTFWPQKNPGTSWNRRKTYLLPVMNKRTKKKEICNRKTFYRLAG